MALEDISATGAIILNPLYTLWNSFVNILPGLLAAILIIILGYAVAYLIGHGLKLLLQKLGLNRAVEKSELTRAVGHTNVSAVIGEITKWYIFIIFLGVAADLLQLGGLSDLLNEFVLWLPNVIAAIIVLFVGIALAYYIEMKVLENTKMKGMRAVAGITKVVVIILAVLVALEQIGVAIGILENTFLIIIGAIGLGIALALGIGLGLGLRESSKKIIEDVRKSF
ncbi:MAG: hypothetical protein AB1571_00625 [Nanoarchaeota archaeon]